MLTMTNVPRYPCTLGTSFYKNSLGIQKTTKKIKSNLKINV